MAAIFISNPLEKTHPFQLAPEPEEVLFTNFVNAKEMAFRRGANHFGFVFSGTTSVRCTSGQFDLGAGMYFSVPGELDISGGRGFVVSQVGKPCFFQIGGPVEASGRLRYIDGCTDSLLIPPVVKGTACLNLLHFPPGIEQTAHTHPSIRLGMVIRGQGECYFGERREFLVEGCVFHIPAETEHRFVTQQSAMAVIAWHPDSDFGPAHGDHPMINRTIVEGTSARFLTDIQTQAMEASDEMSSM